MAGGTTVRQTVRNPQGAQSETHRIVEFRQRPFHVVDGQQPHPDQPVVGAEFGHGAVVCARPAVRDVRGDPLAEQQVGAQRREHQLLGESQPVECVAALRAVERAQCGIALGPVDQSVAQAAKVSCFRGRAAGVGIGLDVLGEGARGLEAEGRQLVGHVPVGVGGQKIRQFHDVAVGVEKSTSVCVGHARSFDGSV